MFLWYNKSHKGYKCLNSNERIFLSRHVKFNGNEFPFRTNFLHTNESHPINQVVIVSLFYISIQSTNHSSLRSSQFSSQPSSSNGTKLSTGSHAARTQLESSPIIPFSSHFVSSTNSTDQTSPPLTKTSSLISKNHIHYNLATLWSLDPRIGFFKPRFT